MKQIDAECASLEGANPVGLTRRPRAACLLASTPEVASAAAARGALRVLGALPIQVRGVA
jgi:hypothetical protein